MPQHDAITAQSVQDGFGRAISLRASKVSSVSFTIRPMKASRMVNGLRGLRKQSVSVSAQQN